MISMTCLCWFSTDMSSRYCCRYCWFIYNATACVQNIRHQHAGICLSLSRARHLSMHALMTRCSMLSQASNRRLLRWCDVKWRQQSSRFFLHFTSECRSEAVITRKPCCSNETARCRSCSFRFKV